MGYKGVFITHFVFLLSFFIGFSILSTPLFSNTNHPDSTIIYYPQTQTDIYDSLLFDFLKEKNALNTEYTNPYGYEFDSVPIFSDSILRYRIEELNALSPFHFIYNEEVRNFIYYFSSKKRGFISRAMARAEFYFPLFEEKLDKYQLPLELKYLAIVESALNPNAKSRAGAVGLWQFMPGTGKMYGLAYNSQLDLRREMYSSTEAACRHFVDLFEIYHDWNLVLAAYNAGPGNVNRAIKKSNNATGYWEIYEFLPKETRGYVPAFIAVNYLMNYSMHHNIFAASNDLEFELQQIDTLGLTEKITFKRLAEITSVSLATIEYLNPQYPKKIIPAKTWQPMTLTLPREGINRFIDHQRNIELLEANAANQQSQNDQ
ncbi:MAG: lytic transglycosylase domain-containing protein [Bacteroidales bacterium]|nr:lytic transglycosylase domain-containing protein [Bacteroidales bacterium]